MKRKVIIATVAAAALVGGGTATAFGAVGNSGGADTKPQSHSNVRTMDHDDDQDDHDGDDRRDDRDDHDGRDGAGSRAHRAEETGTADVSLSRAVEAVHKAAEGDITELDLDTDRNRLVWEADVFGKDGKWHDVKIDATKGKVLKNRVDAHKDDDRSAPRNVKLDAAAAGKKAAAATKGSVTSLDLERNGQWEADAVDKRGTEHELDIDAVSGKVTHHETEKAGNDD
ncbi:MULTISPECIES: PepSY domain-containing protein [unclassified Streptomyces]|uniref:PepSY domain-containing protein n=1 Tax=unclassified Streptomyces TaxID=2593676 RepID=UPI002DDA22C9|nr:MULTISPECIES: PepSY domain-containing protein [unclassified Streptomyces]WSA92294.1 PepSY domain-containing protein [Streptomyces sp. NBC_01795]WSB76663.1 PepSY domain-containing protein [Streptomyces sp. NBC_01775]WSS15050.1 PepSY domain-containing protein [Streptomyces sp. NBC_01186]WSS43893.1 PepSY domain-containing protein [Streptomyces sp. NBC_01187]